MRFLRLYDVLPPLGVLLILSPYSEHSSKCAREAIFGTRRRMLRAMQQRDGLWDLEEVLEACNWDDQAIAVAAGHGLANHGYVKISETSVTDVILGSEGQNSFLPKT